MVFSAEQLIRCERNRTAWIAAYLVASLKVLNINRVIFSWFGVERNLSEEDWLFLRGNTELIVEGVVLDLLHIILVCDDPCSTGYMMV